MLQTALNKYHNDQVPPVPRLRRSSNCELQDKIYQDMSNFCRHIDLLGTHLCNIVNYLENEKETFNNITYLLHHNGIDEMLRENIYSYLTVKKDKYPNFRVYMKNNIKLHYEMSNIEKVFQYTPYLSFECKQRLLQNKFNTPVMIKALGDLYSMLDENEKYKYRCIMDL